MRGHGTGNRRSVNKASCRLRKAGLKTGLNMHRKLKHLILAADLLCIVMSFAIAHLQSSSVTQYPVLPAATTGVGSVALAVALWTVLYFNKGLAGFYRGWHLPATSAQIIVGVFYLLISLFIFGRISYHPYSLHTFVCLASLLPTAFILIRFVAWSLVKSHVYRRPKRRVIIMGNGRIVRELLVKINRHPELSMEVVGVLFPGDTEVDGSRLSFEGETVSLGTLNVLDLIQRKNVCDIILVEPFPSGGETEQMLMFCREAGMKVHIVPQQYQLYLSKARLTEIEDVPLLSLEEQTIPLVSVQLKRAIDIIGTVCILTISLPLFFYSAAVLRWRRKNVFKRELRCGQNGVPFWMYRLNIDRDNPELEALEQFMVRFSLTELPQLFNVLRGDMSLVGPRPEAPARVKHYSIWQRQRLTVKPGLTGLAQVYGLREQHSSEEKVHFDLQYLFHWSVFVDLCLMIQTAWTLLGRLVQENKISVPPLLKTISPSKLEIGRICNADSTQSGAD